MKGWLVLYLLAAPIAPLRAHHSFAAEFDSSKAVTLVGRVNRVLWFNPHVFFFVDVKDASGKVTTWRIESAAPNGLMREGWRKESLKAGDPVTVEGYQAKDEDHFAKTTAVVLPAGRKIYTGYADEKGPGGR